MGTFLGVPIIRIIIYWGLYWGPLILGNYHIGAAIVNLYNSLRCMWTEMYAVLDGVKDFEFGLFLPTPHPSSSLKDAEVSGTVRLCQTWGHTGTLKSGCALQPKPPRTEEMNFSAFK